MPDTPFADHSRVLIVALEGWNDAGDAASECARMVIDQFDLVPLVSIDPEEYFDFQLTRPLVSVESDGTRVINWPDVTLLGNPGVDEGAPLVLLGQEPSRLWRSFAARMVDHALAYDVEAIVFLGAMLADVPHSRPVRVTATSDDPTIRELLGAEKSTYEGPVGVLTVLSLAAAEVGIPSVHLWAQVPHYVHTAPSPKATLAIVDRLEEIVGITVDREDLEVEALRWEEGIDALAEDDDDMSAYIDQLERARDAVDAPEASGDAIAQEFEKYLRGRPERPGSSES
jgi:proteasome assembly chaperone (PAC2) family protein